MARRSSIEDLPKETQERLADLIREGWTLDEITKVLTDMGAQVSRSAVGRYVQKQSMAMLRYQEAQAVAKVWVDRIEAEPDGDVARLLPQMLSAVAFSTIDAMSDAENGAEAMDVMLMAKAIKDLSGAKMSQAQLELKMREVREQARLKALEDAAKVVGEAARAQGMDEEQVDFWRRKVLGVK
jgi:hypothetical protein